ncbi:MAG: hypothetical protein WCA47_17465, partial [Terriglobales bacterium]
MKSTVTLLALRVLTCIAISLTIGVRLPAQSANVSSAQLSSLPFPHNYIQKRASSYDHSGGNDDFRKIAAADTLTLLDDSGPAIITHIWITVASPER